MKVIDRILYSCMLVLLGSGLGYAQETLGSRPLSIGDTLRPLTVGNVINRSENSVEVARLARKGLLIIDFWATWCIPCLSEMKLLDSLKAAHPTKFNVLMVTTQDSATVKKFLADNRDISNKNLYLATNDKQMKSLFPHRYLPHNVWLDDRLKVRAITSSEEITVGNILGFSSLKAQELERKEDNLNFDYFKEFHLADTLYTYRSLISPYIKGVSGIIRGNHPLSRESRQHLYVNGTIVQQLWSAYMGGPIRYELIEVQTKDSLRFFFPTGKNAKWLKNSKYETQQQWYRDNLFCYALTLPKPVSLTKKRDYIFRDFERQFAIGVGVEERRTKVVYVRKGKRSGLAKEADRKIGPSMIKWLPDHQLQIQWATLEEVCNWFFQTSQAKAAPYPFVVNTKKKEYLNLIIDFTPHLNPNFKGIDQQSFISAFQSLGYQIQEREMNFPKLVIRDLN